MSRTYRAQAKQEWTAAQALSAQARFQRSGGTLGDPTGPVSQWAALQKVTQCKAQHDRGDKGAILEAIAECARTGLVMPDWLVRAFLGAYRRVIHHDQRSWDDVFGEPHVKGAHLAALKKQRRLSVAVWNDVNGRRAAGAALDDGLYELVAAQHGIGVTTAKKYYAHAKAIFGRAPPGPARQLLDHFLLTEAKPKSRKAK